MGSYKNKVYQMEIDAIDAIDEMLLRNVVQALNLTIIEIREGVYTIIGGRTNLRKFIRDHYDVDDFKLACATMSLVPNHPHNIN